MIRSAYLLCGTYAECVATDLTSDFHKRTQRGMREYMKRGLIDIGVVLPAANGGKCHTYHIYRDKLDRHLGKIQPRLSEEE